MKLNLRESHVQSNGNLNLNFLLLTKESANLFSIIILTNIGVNLNTKGTN